MKRTLSGIAFILLLIVFASGAFAENPDFSDVEFEIRGGVKYSSTWVEIKEIETKQNDMTFIRTQKHDGKVSEDNQGIFEGSIAGFRDSDMYYLFRDSLSGRMYQIKYQFSEKNDSPAVYNEMKAALSDKYGPPNLATSGLMNEPVWFRDNAYGKEVSPFSEWLIRFKDCYVDIGLYIRDGDQCCIVYSLYSYEEMEDKINGDDKKEQIKRDL